YNHPGALVDHDPGGEIRLDLQLLDLGEQRYDIAGIDLRHVDLHGRGIQRLGRVGADEVVDRGGDAFGSGEVGIAKRQPHLVQAVEREIDLALDDRAVG